MNGRRLVLGLLVFVAVFGAALVYFQFFAFYDRATTFGPMNVDGAELEFLDYEGIDASSSPLKLRGCFQTQPDAFMSLPAAEDPTPLTPPPWFGCFDARAISEDIAAGRANAYLLATDAPDGFDLIAAIYPDGRREVLSKLDWQHRWHTTFLFEDHVQPLLPKGTLVVLTSFFDNTADNPGNPDPDQLVVFGRRSVDEMSHIWIGRTFFEQVEFDRLVAEREELLQERARSNTVGGGEQ